MPSVVRGVLSGVLLAVAACAPRAGTHVPSDHGLASLRPAAAALRGPDLSVACADGACPSAVGVLYHAADGAPQRCTAALVAPDRVLTAGHCLPRGRRAAGDGCGDVVVAFPAAGGFEEERRICTHVVGATPSDDRRTLTPDYAILALDRPTRRHAFELDPAPLDPGTVVTVVASSPDRHVAGAHSVRARRCRVDGPEAATAALGPRAADVAWLGLCPIRPGNSGAPVLDGTGHVRGIVHGGSAPFHAHAVVTPAATFPAP